MKKTLLIILIVMLSGCSLTITIDKPTNNIQQSDVRTGDIDDSSGSATDQQGDPSLEVDAGGLVQ